MTDFIVNSIVWGVIFWAVKSLYDTYSVDAPSGCVQNGSVQDDDFMDFAQITHIETEATNPATGLTMCGGFDAGGNAYGESGDSTSFN